MTGAISVLQGQPMEPEVWQRLANCLRAQGDSLSSDSLDLIVEGLWELKNLFHAAAEKGEPLPELSSAKLSLFSRLSTSYNDPKILKKIGEIYLVDWGLVDIARKHFERALFLGGPEKELKPLLEATRMTVTPVAPEKHEASQAQASATKACLEKAEQMLEKGELAQAEMHLQEANQNPAEAEKMGAAWAQLGLAYAQTLTYAKMEEAFLWAIRYEQNQMVYAFNLALAQQSLGKSAEAEANYLLADRIQPGDAKVWCNLGALYFQNARYAEAEVGLKKAVSANPQYARAWDNLAAVLGAQDKLDEALLAIETALRLKPGYAEAYFKLGVILLKKDRLPEARNAFQRSLCVSDLIEPAQAYLSIIESRWSP